MSRRVKVGKDPRNKHRPWVVRWSDGIDLTTEKVRWSARSFKYRMEADVFAAQKRVEPPDLSEIAGSANRMTLGRFIREWSQTRSGGDYQPGTRTLDQNTVARLLAHFGKDVSFADITPMEAAKFIAGLARLDGREKALSAWSRARTLRNVRNMFNTAVEWGLVKGNPFCHIKQPKLAESRWHYLSPEEFHALLNASRGTNSVPLRCKVIYALAYCCGLRLGEILNLRWDQNFSGDTVRIENRPATATAPPFTIKDKEARTIHVPKRCLELLAELRVYNGLTDQTPYVVLDQGQHQTMQAKWRARREDRRPWQNHDMQNNTLLKFKRHVRWAGIKPEGSLSLHTLRKACITNWANEINNPEVVRRLAGHADIKTTMQFYSTVTAEQRRKAAAAIDRLLEAGLVSGVRYV